MTARELFEVIGQMDDDLVLAADAVPRRRARTILRRVLPAAACLSVTLLGVWYLRGSSGAASPGTGSEAVADLRSEGSPEMLADAAAPAQYAGALNGTEAAAQLEDNAGAGSVSLTARRAEELFFAEGLTPSDEMPVYRSTLTEEVHEDAMRSRLRQVLTALGADSAQADTAELVSDYAGGLDALQQTADKLRSKAEQYGWGDQVLREYWNGAARLTAQVPVCDAWPDGLRVTVSNDLSVTVQGESEDPLLSVTTRAGADEAAGQAGERYGALLTGLLGDGYRSITDGGDCATTGETMSATLQFESRPGCRAALSLRTDGRLASLQLTDPPMEELGRYPVLDREAADRELAAGNYVGSSSLTAEELADPDRLVCARLCYRGSTLLFPCWEYVVDEGETSCTDDGEPLHSFCVVYVPAVAVSELAGAAD